MAKILLFLATCLTAPDHSRSHAIEQYVDLVEVNHYFDDAGKPVFDQLIFYTWDATANRFSVVAWRLIKNPHQIPVRQAGTGRYYSAWHDGKILRIVHADRSFESWTQYDPETVERAYLSKEQRPDLIKPEKDK